MQIPETTSALMQLIEAYDLNPLMAEALRHYPENRLPDFCEVCAFVSPRRNRDSERAPYESLYLKVALRDTNDFEKIREVRIVHAFVHKRLFVFSQS